MTHAKKKELAQHLFVVGGVTNQTELASIVGVRPATITKWKKSGGWDQLKKSLLVTRQAQLAFLYDQLERLSEHINKDENRSLKVATNKEADTYIKLTAAIKNLERDASIPEIISVQLKFNEFIAEVDVEQAQLIFDYQDAFVKSLL